MAIDRNDKTLSQDANSGAEARGIQVAQTTTTANDAAAAQVIQVSPGARIELPQVNLAEATLTLVGNDLTITQADGTVILLQDFVVAAQSDTPPELIFAEGLELSSGDMLAAAVAQTAPAAGPAAGPAGAAGDDDGTTVAPQPQGPIGDGFGIIGPLGPTALSFAPPEVDVATVGVEEGITVSVFDAEPVFEPSANGSNGGGVVIDDSGPFEVTTSTDGELLAQTILGPGISIVPGSIVYTGASSASGTFTGGGSTGIGIGNGLLMTSGNANLALGPNTNDGATGNNGAPGDSDLDALIPGFSTNDAAILEFDFETGGGDLFFNFVFASEEYNEFTNSSFNDVFGFFVDGQNIALIPGTDTPISINNVNGGNPFGVNSSNSEFFVNNDLSDGGPFFNIEYDGFTKVFTVSAIGIGAGEHHIKLAIADAGDSVLDSAVFIQGGSFSDQPLTTVATFPIRLSGPSDVPVTVAYETVDGSATAGEDYVFTSGTVTFQPGETELFVKVPILSDDVLEGTETFTLSLTSATGASIDDGSAVGTILEKGPCAELKEEMAEAQAAFLATFPDVIGGADADDLAVDDPNLLVGDLYVQETDDDIEESIDVSHSVFSSDGTVAPFDATNDLLDASGNSDSTTLVGDVFLDQLDNNDVVELTISVENSVDQGNDNTFDAYQDVLKGGSGNDAMVGDFFLAGVDSNTAELTVDVSNDVTSGDGNDFNAFNDVLEGGSGADVMVGDAAVYIEGSSPISADLNVYNNLYGGSENTFSAFNDILDGGDGGDFMVGDLLFGGTPANSSALDVTLDVENYFYAAQGSVDADNNSFTAFDDLLEGGAGNDVLVGDMFVEQDTLSENDLSLDVSNGVHSFGEGSADDNSFSAFDDILDGGAGSDLLVGDIFVTQDTTSGMSYDLSLTNTVGGGNDNSFSAFNDYLAAGEPGEPGPALPGFSGSPSTVAEAEDNANDAADNDTPATAEVMARSAFGFGTNSDLVDDSQAWMSVNGEISHYNDVDYYEIQLSAGETISLDTDNTTFDTQLFLFDADLRNLEGDDDNDDGIDPDSAGADSYLEYTVNETGTYYVAVSSYSNSPSGGLFGGDGDFNGDGSSEGTYVLNMSVASDEAATGEVLVGDFLIEADGSSNYFYIDLDNSIEGGEGNTFETFNDVLLGGSGSDLLVGDVMVGEAGEYYYSGELDLYVTVGGNGEISAFNDHLCGAAGDDQLYGDFFAQEGAAIEFDFDNLFGTVADLNSSEDTNITLFEDVLLAGGGDDLLVGGLGSDTMTGGSGQDTYDWTYGEDIGHGWVDTITDFAAGEGSDVLDLADLFDEITGGSPTTVQAAYDEGYLRFDTDDGDGGLTVGFDQNGYTGGGFSSEWKGGTVGGDYGDDTVAVVTLDGFSTADIQTLIDNNFNLELI